LGSRIIHSPRQTANKIRDEMRNDLRLHDWIPCIGSGEV
jgi:hypothetical protein